MITKKAAKEWLDSIHDEEMQRLSFGQGSLTTAPPVDSGRRKKPLPRLDEYDKWDKRPTNH
jgi:hypothetical protein